eukprot:COSAG06_NODE_38669_length_421_cov_0.711180_1_plen_28_part_01
MPSRSPSHSARKIQDGAKAIIMAQAAEL